MGVRTATSRAVGGALVAWAWLGAGCSGTSHEFLQLPELTEFESVVLIAGRENVRALASTPERLEPFDVDPDEPVWLLAYAPTLEMLRTEDGELDPEDPDRSCLLFEPDATWAMTFDDDGDPTFVSIAGEAEVSLGDEHLDLLAGPGGAFQCARCPNFEVERVPLGGNEAVAAAVLLPSGDLYLSRLSEHQVLTPDDEVVDLECPQEIEAAELFPDGSLWAAYENWSGRMRVDLETATCTVTDSWPLPLEPPGPDVKRWYKSGVRSGALSGAGEPLEIWALTGRGRVWNFDGDAWAQRAELEVYPEDQPDQDPESVKIVRRGPNQIAATLSNDRVLLLDDGVSQLEYPPLVASFEAGNDRVTALGALSDGRLIAGGGSGEVWIRNDSRWQRVPGTPLGSARDKVGAFIEDGRRIIVTVDRGRVAFIHHERGLCPEAIEVPGSFRDGFFPFVRADGSIVIADFVGESDQVQVEAIVLRPPEP